MHLQATRPDTLGVLLLDSPTSLAAWILDKFLEWAHHDNALDAEISRDRILTNIMVRPASSAAAAAVQHNRYAISAVACGCVLLLLAGVLDD